MRILVIHQYFLRPGEPGGSRFNDFARSWRAEGHEVHVVASSVRYASGDRDDEAVWPWRRGHEEGTEVVRTWALPHPKGRFATRIASMAAYGALGAVAASLRQAAPDVVVASSPTLAAFLPGLIASSRWGCRLVLEVRDLWPESIVSLGGLSENSLATRAAYGFEEAAYELADVVVALTPGIRDRLVERGVVEPQRCVVIPNGVDVAGLRLPERDEARRRLGLEGRFVAVYTGAHGIANGLDQLIEAAELLRPHKDVLILSIGAGPQRERLRREGEARGLENLRWLEAVSREELLVYLSAADAGIVSLHETQTFETVYPNKMFDYMSASLPVVLGVEGVAARLVNEADAGVCFPPQQPAELARALLFLRDHPARAQAMGHRGRACVERDFDRDRQARAYLDVLRGANRAD